MKRSPLFKFRLYLAGDSLNSVTAHANLAALCNAHLPDCHEIEIVDVFKEPKRALTDAVYMTPMLIKLGPNPVKRIVGTLNQTKTVLLALGLDILAS